MKIHARDDQCAEQHRTVEHKQREKRESHRLSAIVARFLRSGIQICPQHEWQTDSRDQQQPVRDVPHAGEKDRDNLPEHHAKRDADEEYADDFLQPNAGFHVSYVVRSYRRFFAGFTIRVL